MARETAEALRGHLDAAHQALAAGEAAAAERAAKAVSAIVRAEREVAEFLSAPPPSPEEDEEAIRAEIRSRIRKLALARQPELAAEATQPEGA